jgi:hypothetical protein
MAARGPIFTVSLAAWARKLSGGWAAFGDRAQSQRAKFYAPCN